MAADQSALAWRGIHHIALITPDLDATVHFYRDVLGMQVSDIYPSREGRGRHCLVFAKPNDSDTWGLHFFERSLTSDPFTSTAGALLHIAFRLPDEASANILRERLHGDDVQITEIQELGTFLFSDNNRIILEATWPREQTPMY